MKKKMKIRGIVLGGAWMYLGCTEKEAEGRGWWVFLRGKAGEGSKDRRGARGEVCKVQASALGA